MGVPLDHPFLDRIFPNKNKPFWSTPMTSWKPAFFQAARVIVEKYYGKLTLDFQVNKKITEEPEVMGASRLGGSWWVNSCSLRRYTMKCRW